MTGTSRLLACCALLAAACGAGDNRIDPGDLELRDLLGMSPEAATAWDRDQRASARHVIEDGLHQTPAAPIRAALVAETELDRQVAKSLASVDADRARHHAGALGLVHLALGPGDVVATARAATIAPHARAPVEIRLAGWEAEPAWRPLPARGLDVLAEIAVDAGHASGPIVVAPAPRLAVVAGYLPATARDPARLVVNPVLLAALEPVAAEVESAGAVAGSPRNAPAAPAPPPSALAANAEGNPYSFYGSVAECAAAQRARCEACLGDGSCTAITNLGDGNAECTQLGAQGGRGYFLICINLALAIDAVAACTQGRASCPRDTHASESISSLESNAGFLDDAACGGPLDACLAKLYGPSQGGFPGPGSDAGSGAPPPRNTSIGCSDSCSDDSNCDAELEGPSCDDPAAGDGGCADSNPQSGCDSGDGGDSCSSDSGSGCDSGGDCSSDSSGDCGGGGGGGDCSGGGGGGDCSGGGGGGDCSGGGGGGDCNAGARHGRSTGGGLPIALLWAFLPVPFAARVRQRAVRKRAQAEVEAQAEDGARSPELPS